MASIIRPHATRAVHLRIHPRPSNLGESREILRLISQFGEVEYFKNLKYDTLTAPNTSLVIFRDEASAQHCLKRSPIRFRMGREPLVESNETRESAPPQPAQETTAHEVSSEPGPTGPFGAPFGLSQIRSMSTSSRPQTEQASAPSEPTTQDLQESRIFQISVNNARVNFRDRINQNKYHGFFAMDSKHVAQKDLAKNVPLGGLACIDWRAEEKPWRVIRWDKEREYEGPERKKPLRELYEEGPEGIAAFRDESLPG